jgi:hypothetical protein
VRAQPVQVSPDGAASRAVEEGGIPGVVVKCVEIRRNTGGEGGLLGRP